MGINGHIILYEDYVSFETAKLLKEKGFNWEWSPFYSEQDRDEWTRNNNYNIPNPNYDANIPFDSEILNVIAPHVSLQMAMKWLREVCNIEINVSMSALNSDNSREYMFNIFFTNERYLEPSKTKTGFKCYEEAAEAAIKYCLTNLIK